jgi:hypothetical protein
MHNFTMQHDDSSALAPLNTDDLLRLAAAHHPLTEPGGRAKACAVCAPLVCPGWESMPPGLDAAAVLQRVGSLRGTQDEDPTLEEFHPAGTHLWSAQAPVALGYFPYNRCELWRCRSCARPFLRYTEYGGYYEEDRIRELNPALLVRA